ncbi:hypothetical protein FG386_002467 [Cryptosporidium ryanae]|uniref:uncharacterized protein n=1 Tax=Cryptosporidium ryanae TaxID=515981 RepID=UPI003519E6BE|nr:hypothetical protein FG386_002467 [Cryptosporidium ryanae]
MNIHILAKLVFFAIFNVFYSAYRENYVTSTRLILLSLIKLGNKTSDNQFKECLEGNNTRNDEYDIGVLWIYPLVSLEIKYQRLRIESEMFHSRTVYRRILVAKGMKESRVHPEDVLCFNTSFVSGDRVNFGEMVGTVYYFRNKKSEDLVSSCKGIIGSIQTPGYHGFEEVLFIINCDSPTFGSFGVYSQRVLPDLNGSERALGSSRYGSFENLGTEGKRNKCSRFENKYEVKNDLEREEGIIINSEKDVGKTRYGVNKEYSEIIRDIPEIDITQSIYEYRNTDSSFPHQRDDLFLHSDFDMKNKNLDSKMRIRENKEAEHFENRGTRDNFRKTNLNANSNLSSPFLTQGSIGSRVELPKLKEENEKLFNGLPWFFKIYIPIFVLAIIVFIARINDSSSITALCLSE